MDEMKDLSLPRWIAPDGKIHLFCNCKNISIDDDQSYLDIEGVTPQDKIKNVISYEIENEISLDDASAVVGKWADYLESLISTKPFPGSGDAGLVGCKCLIAYAHDPQCPVVTGPDSIRPLPPVTPATPTTSNEHLNDILADLTHRMMDQNVTLDALVKALMPSSRQDPYYVPIPGFKNLADREPTDIERQCFLSGIMRIVVELANHNIEGTVQMLFDRLGVPTVKCGCGRRVPLERSIRDNDGSYYGVDCCGDED